MDMDNQQEYIPQQEAEVVINYDEPTTKPPPILDVGAIAWLRKNLFGSPLDVVLTLLGFLIIVTVIVTFLEWSVQSADWLAIHLNLQRLLVDRLSDDNVWRMINASLFISLAAGITVAAYYRRLSIFTIASTLVIIVPIFILPTIIKATLPMPPTYMAAGATITLGTLEETPFDQIAFVGNPDETVRVRLADDVGDEASLASIGGFMDRATNTLRNAAITRIEDEARIEELTRIILEDSIRRAQEANSPAGVYGTLTPDQRERVYAEYEDLIETGNPDEQEAMLALMAQIQDPDEVADLNDEESEALIASMVELHRIVPILEQFDLNNAGVVVRILDANMQPVTESVVLSSLDDVLEFVPTEEAWYVLDKRVEESENSVAVLHLDSIYPLFKSGDTYRPMPEEEPVIDQPLPKVNEDDDVAFVSLLRNQYRGERDIGAYLRIYVAPFLEKITPGVIQLVLAFIVGFAMARLADWQFSPTEKWNKQSRRMSTWAIILTPIIFFLYVNGIGVAPLGLDFTDPRRWGGLLLAGFITFYGIIIAFPLGIGLALGRRSELPAIRYLSTLVIETVRGTPFIVVLFAGQLFIPLLHPSFAEIPNAYRALGSTIIFIAAYLAENVRGGLQSIPPGQEEAARALGLSNWQITYFITLPQALRAVIPALVGQFISLFKDTSLLAIVGLIDLTGVVNTMVAQAEFNDARREGLLVISIIYFVISYVMSYVSRRIEESGSGSARRI
jgi:His/Glu/Gln/Arg/opine family amino acid ABC transporter permease subunit